MDNPSKQNLIPLSEPQIAGNEWKYIKECLDTGWVSSAGPFVNRFEQLVADRVGAKYAVATCNGTAALHTALIVAGIRPDDEILVSTLTFIASANAIRYAGAWPVFMDCDRQYWQMDPEKVIEFIEKQCHWTNGELKNNQSGRPVKAIMPCHVLGHCVEIDPIVELARKYDLVVIEDAAESLGTRHKARGHAGHLGNLGCFSFNGNKIITTGGGGMLVTDDYSLAERAKYLTTQAKDDPVEYMHGEVGYNYRLTNIQAALGCAQMEQLDDHIASKRRIAAVYSNAFAKIPGITPMMEPPWAMSTFWLYTALIHEKEYGIDSRSLLERLANEGIQTRPLWQPLHRSNPHRSAQAYRIENADAIYRAALSFPSSPGLTVTELQYVLQSVESFSRARNHV